jgi:hypothetical protein
VHPPLHLDDDYIYIIEPGARVPDQSNPMQGHNPRARVSRPSPHEPKLPRESQPTPRAPDPCDSAIFRLGSVIWRYCKPFSSFTRPFGYSELNHFWYSELSHFYL